MEGPRRRGRSPPPNEGDRRLAHHLRRLRREARLPLSAVGDALGLTYQAIHRVEMQKSRLHVGHVYLCAELFGVSVDTLLAPIDATPAPALPDEHSTVVEFFEALRGLPDAKLAAIASFARALAAERRLGTS